MKIWIVKHEMDNGEKYREDYDHWETYKYFSSLDKAECYYYPHVCEKYEGKFILIEKTLDTQEEEILEESPWENCIPDDGSEYDFPEPDYDYDYYPPMPEDNIKEAWDYIDKCEKYEDLDESELIEEYMKTPHENYEIYQEILNDQLEDLNNMLKDLGLTDYTY